MNCGVREHHTDHVVAVVECPADRHNAAPIVPHRHDIAGKAECIREQRKIGNAILQASLTSRAFRVAHLELVNGNDTPTRFEHLLVEQAAIQEGVGGVAVHAQKRAAALTLGCRAVFDYNDPALSDAIRAATGGRGVDMILDTSAGVHIGHDLAALAPGGRLSFLSPGGGKELGVLEELLRAEGAVVSSEELLERVWDEFADPFTTTVRVTVMTLRKKLGDPPVVQTVVGAGYRLGES